MLRNRVTTVRDSYGALVPLVAIRDSIAASAKTHRVITAHPPAN